MEKYKSINMTDILKPEMRVSVKPISEEIGLQSVQEGNNSSYVMAMKSLQ